MSDEGPIYEITQDGWDEAAALIARLVDEKSSDHISDTDRVLLVFVHELLATFALMLRNYEEASQN